MSKDAAWSNWLGLSEIEQDPWYTAGCAPGGSAPPPPGVVPLSGAPPAGGSSVAAGSGGGDAPRGAGAGAAGVSGARELLASAQAVLLRERLEAEAGRRGAMPVAELRALAQEVGAAACAEEAAAMCRALHLGGVIMQVGGVAYLRPGAVARSVLQAVPAAAEGAAGAGEDLRRLVREVEEELAPMERAHAARRAAAESRRNAMVWGGLALYAVPNVLFFRLCFWELGWDSVEPLTYFAGQTLQIAAYTYFAVTLKDWSPESYTRRYSREALEIGLAESNLDQERHAVLKRRLEALRAQLQMGGAEASSQGEGGGGPLAREGEERKKNT